MVKSRRMAIKNFELKCKCGYNINIIEELKYIIDNSTWHRDYECHICGINLRTYLKYTMISIYKYNKTTFEQKLVKTRKLFEW